MNTTTRRQRQKQSTTFTTSAEKEEPAQAFVSNACADIEENWERTWILDTGATRHMTGDRTKFQVFGTGSTVQVVLGNDAHLDAEGEGLVEIEGYSIR
jgi:hypothetical protein